MEGYFFSFQYFFIDYARTAEIFRIAVQNFPIFPWFWDADAIVAVHLPGEIADNDEEFLRILAFSDKRKN